MKKTAALLLCAALALALIPTLAEGDLSGYFKTWTLDYMLFNGDYVSAADLGYQGNYVIFHEDGTVDTGTEGNMHNNPWTDTGDGLMISDSADDVYRLQPDGTLLVSYQGPRTDGNLIEMIFVEVPTGVSYTEADLAGQWNLESMVADGQSYTYQGDADNPSIYMLLNADHTFSLVAISSESGTSRTNGTWSFDGTFLRTFTPNGVDNYTFTVTDIGRLRADMYGSVLTFAKQ